MRQFSMTVTLAASLVLAACASRQPAQKTAEVPHDITSGAPVAWDVTGQPVMARTSPQTAETPAPSSLHETVRRELKAAYFDYDKATLRPEAKAALRENASWLKANPSTQVLVEGYCDKPGTVEYNLLLGERRAKAVRDYLSALGIESERVKVVSYGNSPGVDRKAALKVVRND